MARRPIGEPRSRTALYWSAGYTTFFALLLVLTIGRDDVTQSARISWACFVTVGLLLLYQWDQSQLRPRLPGAGKKQREADRADAEADTPFSRE